MRRISLLAALLMVMLSSCGSGTKQGPQATQPSPYPSVPMNEVVGSGGEKSFIPTPEAEVIPAFTVKGTEPFWSVEIEKNTATLTRPGTGSTSTETFNIIGSDKGSTISLRGVKGDFFLTLIKGSCSDGASDTKYAFNATLNVGAEELHGCANKK
ncbi:MAG: membrane protein [Candidatus Altimarinota bacterium]